MRLTFWLAGVPLLLIGAFFAVANRELVAVDLWPLAGRVSVPLFAALVGALYVGFVLGAAVAWWSGRRVRGRGRETRRRLMRAEEENARLLARLDSTPTTPAAGTASSPPALTNR